MEYRVWNCIDCGEPVLNLCHDCGLPWMEHCDGCAACLTQECPDGCARTDVPIEA